MDSGILILKENDQTNNITHNYLYVYDRFMILLQSILFKVGWLDFGLGYTG